MKKIVHKSAAPIYAAAVVWVLYALLLPLYKPGHFMMAAAASVVVFLIARIFCKDVVEEVEEKPQPTGNPELDKMISDGELAIREMKRLNDSIKDETTLKLLNAYDRMSSQGVEGQNISGTMERVESMMSNIVTAFERLLDSLFGDQALDISTDITVLENMMAREGLSDDPIHQTQKETPAAEEKESGEDGDGIQLEL